MMLIALAQMFKLRPRLTELSRLSSGTLYPLLHGLEEKGYLRSSEENNGRRSRRVYRATPKGRRALAAAKVKVHELFSELLEEKTLEESSQHRTTDDKDLMKGLFSQLRAVTLPKLRQSARTVKEPKAQVLLGASVAVVEGLIKAFDEYEKRRKAQT